MKRERTLQVFLALVGLFYVASISFERVYLGELHMREFETGFQVDGFPKFFDCFVITARVAQNASRTRGYRKR